MGAITDDDVTILRGLDPSVCHCPSASMFGGFGCITHGKFPELVEHGVRVVLGSDACAVSRFIDMVRIMYLAACAHKDVKADPTVIGAHKAMEMATIDGARALMLDHEVGSLEASKLADIVIADAGGIEWQPNPTELPVANLVYSGSGSCVRTVVIDGRVVMEDRRFTMIDEAEYVARAGRCANQIFSRLGLQPRVVWPVWSFINWALSRLWPVRVNDRGGCVHQKALIKKVQFLNELSRRSLDGRADAPTLAGAACDRIKALSRTLG